MSLKETTSLALENSVVSAENPWPGLESFREADQRWFQGRREETMEVVKHVKLERLTVVFALSGIGKSSLLQAGVFPELRRDRIFPVYIRLRYVGQNPDLRGQVFSAISHAGSAAGVSTPSPREGQTLWEYFHHVTADFWTSDKDRALPLLVFDQFEEIFTPGRAPDWANASEAFLDELADLAEGTVPVSVTQRWARNPADKDEYAEQGEFKVLISLREDFLAELLDQKRRIATIPQYRYRLRQMNGEGALLAVSQAKDLVDSTVAEQIVRYVAAGERLGGGRRGRPLKDLDVEPALLSVVCRELNEKRRQKGERRISVDLLEGEQEQVLSAFYNRSFEGMPPAVRAFVEEKLITVAGARDSVPQENALGHSGMTSAILEQLVERRLIRREFRRGRVKDEVRLELTHDILIGVVRASRDARRGAEERARQEQEKQEALRKLRRSRQLVLSFGSVAVVAVAAAVFGFVEFATARAETLRVIEARKAEAEQSEKTKAEKLRADSKAEEAEKNSIEARKNAEAALQKSEEAQASAAAEAVATRNALASASEADKAKILANQAAAQSRADAAKALAAEATAKANEAEALAAKLSEQKANEDLARKNRETEKEVAQNLVNDSPSLIGAGQAAKALGNVARALTLNPDSMGARSLAFDLLLRGAWAPPVAPGSAGAEQFIHPALSHPAGVFAAVFSPDGRQLATASADKLVRLWDWRANRSLGEFTGHTSGITSLAFSSDGRRIVSASNDQTARVWDVAGRTQLQVLHHAGRVTSAMFSSDGRLVVTASEDKTAQIWDAATGAKTGNPLLHTRSVNFASFNKDATQVVTACSDGIARLWESATGAPAGYEMSHGGEIRSAVFNGSGTRVVTASTDGSARVWDIASRSPVGDPMRHGSTIYSASFSPDGKRVATASKDNTARVWDALTGRAVTAPLPHRGFVLDAAFSPDSHRLVTASLDRTAQVWDVWYDFENSEDLIRLVEGVGNYSGKDLSPLPAGEARQRLDSLRAKAGLQSPGSFMRWFFAHRQ